RADHVLERVRVFALAESLGGVESLISLPAAMTHASVPPERRAAMGMSDGLIRLSCGVEDLGDLLADLEHAFEGLPGNRATGDGRRAGAQASRDTIGSGAP
ncbi:MAG: PLP-dependent transferase, partial [Deltaproteobacteria bacterium]